MRPPERRSRSLLPREHGAWLPLLFPLATALLQGRPVPAAFALAIAAVCAFLAHEPLLVALGRRGSRAAEFAGSRAARRVALLAVVFAITGTAGLALAPPDARVAAIAVGWLGAIGLTAAVLGVERGAAAQLLAAVVLPAAAVPVALASGVPRDLALTSFASWSIAFAIATLAVRTVLGGRRRTPILCAAVVAPLATAGWSAGVPVGPVFAVLPLVVAAVVVALVRPPARRVARVGFSFVAASAVSLALFLWR